MTSKLTREERVQALYDLKVGQVLSQADIENVKMLSRMALAAMDSEPVAVIDLANLDYLLSGADADVWPPEREEMGDVLLYRHTQPAPVVPEEWTIADAVKFCKETGRQDAGAAMDAWNACRAAMLQAGNSPVIPEGSEQRIAEAVELLKRAAPAMLSDDSGPNGPLVGRLKAQAVLEWIPVSERMPDVGVKVLCFPVKDEPIHATFNGQLWLQDVSWSGSDDPIDNVIPVSVTHWMPLPAAPQEAK